MWRAPSDILYHSQRYHSRKDGGKPASNGSEKGCDSNGNNNNMAASSFSSSTFGRKLKNTEHKKQYHNKIY